MHLVAFRYLSMPNVQVLYVFHRVSVYMFKDFSSSIFLGGWGSVCKVQILGDFVIFRFPSVKFKLGAFRDFSVSMYSV